MGRLDDLVDQVNDKVGGAKDPSLPYVGLEHIGQDVPVLLGTLPSEASTSVNSVFKQGDILFGKLRPNLHKSLATDFDGYCSTDILVLRARAGVSPQYAAKVFQWESVFEEAVRSAEGTKMPRTSWEKLKAFRVYRPSYADQDRIADILDTIDEAIQGTEALIAKLKQMKAGLLHDLLTRGLDEHGQLRDPVAHPEQFKDSPLGRIPRRWDVQRVGEKFDMQLGKMLDKSAKIGHHPFPYLANRNVHWDEVELTELEWMDFNEVEREKFSLVPGDLLVCEGGEVGRTAIWRGEMRNCYFQKAIHRLRPKNSSALPGYMLRFMREAATRGLLTSYTSQTSIAHLTREKFALLPLPLPSVEEQQSIVAALDAHDARIRAEEAYRDKLKLQKKGLMHDLLTGRVRVGIADEVAS